MKFVPYGPKNILRPDPDLAQEINLKARRSLLRQFNPGRYVGTEQVNPILKAHFDFYDSRLRRLAPLLASRDTTDLLLFQYDEATEILHGANIHSQMERESWARIEPSFRRGIKFLVELFCITQNPRKSKISGKRGWDRLGEALLCAEHAADLSEISDRSFQIFPQDFGLVLNTESSPHIFETFIQGEHSNFDRRFGERLARDREARDRFMGGGFKVEVRESVLLKDIVWKLPVEAFSWP